MDAEKDRNAIESRVPASDSSPKGPPSGSVDFASWLSREILLLAGWFRAQEGAPVELSLFRDSRIVPVDTEWEPYRRPDLVEVDPLAGKLIVMRIAGAADTDGRIGSLVVKVGGATFGIGPAEIAGIVDDFATVVQSHFAALDQGTRMKLNDFLASALDRFSEPANAYQLSRKLHVLRESLRRRLPSANPAPDRARGLNVDALIRIDLKSFYVNGWMKDDEAPTTRLTAVSPEGSRADLMEGMFRHLRPDIERYYSEASASQKEKYGFIRYFEIDHPSRLPLGWLLEMGNLAGVETESEAPAVIRDADAALDAILGDLAWEHLEGEDLMLHHTFPALSRLQERRAESAEVESEHSYGPIHASAPVSIVVPLYQRVDLLEHQLAQFVHDPEIREADLIYVLDSPELANGLRDRASQLSSFYRVPFRLVVLKRNMGFSTVNNVGASLAHGRLLLLLNSDVLPDRPGWLGRMIGFYDSQPGIGALGPKLLYEDESLQHAGMYFNRLPGSRLWENRHYYKGLHRHFPAADLTRPVPAVTAACMMIDRSLYADIGGLRNIYVRGGYEDSDLCLRLMEAGRRNWYLSEIELFHLEGQSYPFPVRQLGLRYNRWLHTRLWYETMETVMSRFASTADGKIREEQIPR